MTTYFFSQQASNWQQIFRRSQSGGFFKRLFAWLVLGLFMAVGLVVVIGVMLLSWLLIPVLLYKKRRMMERMRAAAASQGHYARSSSQGDVIDGVITEVKEDRVR